LGYETLLRWDRDGRTIIPNIAERVEVLDDARTFVFHLRRGMRWSDGEPFTSADFRYQHEHVLNNPRLTPSIPEFLTRGDQVFELETPDPHTVIMRFRESYGLFPQVVCFRGRQNSLFAPAHYLRQFHATFTDEAELTA